MHLNPTRVITLVLCSFCSFSGVFAAGNSAPVQGYIGQGIGKSSNFMITNSYQAQYRYIQLDIDPEVTPTPPSNGGGGAQGPETSHTQYKTQICQCDGGGNASCVNAFVQDVNTQNCLKSSSDRTTCLAPWAQTMNYQLCAGPQDCSCGDEPLYPSAPNEPESSTEENTISPTDEELTDSEAETENPNPTTDVDGSLEEENSPINTPDPVAPTEENTNLENEKPKETPSEEVETSYPSNQNNSTGNTNSSGSGNSSGDNSPINIFDPLTLGELRLQYFIDGKGLFGEIYDPSKHTNLWFPTQEESLYTSAPEEPAKETCVSCYQIWFNHLRVNICILFWITLGLLLVSIGTNVFWLKKYKRCHKERKFLLTKKQIQTKK